MMFGLPRVITSDQGREFNNALDSRLMEMMGVEHRLTTPYHPQVRSQEVYTNAYLSTGLNRQMVWMRGLTRPSKICWLNLLLTRRRAGDNTLTPVYMPITLQGK